MLPVTSPARIVRSIWLKISVSTVPRTSRTLSYVSFCRGRRRCTGPGGLTRLAWSRRPPLRRSGWLFLRRPRPLFHQFTKTRRDGIDRDAAEIVPLASGRIVTGILFASVVARSREDDIGRRLLQVFKSALNAPVESICTSSMI